PHQKGTVHRVPDPSIFPYRSYGSTDCGNAALFWRSDFAGRACAVLWSGDDFIVLCYIPDLFWRNNIPVQTSRSSIGKGTSIRPEYLSYLVGFLYSHAKPDA